MYVGLFVEVVRINYGCRLNVYLRFLERRLIMEIMVYVVIELGEEILMSCKCWIIGYLIYMYIVN